MQQEQDSPKKLGSFGEEEEERCDGRPDPSLNWEHGTKSGEIKNIFLQKKNLRRWLGFAEIPLETCLDSSSSLPILLASSKLFASLSETWGGRAAAGKDEKGKKEGDVHRKRIFFVCLPRDISVS